VSAVVAADFAERAAALQSLWSQLAMQHVALGASCGCGVGGVSLRLEDFELDIVGYLEDAGQRCEIEAVALFFRGFEQQASREQPLRALLADVEDERLPAAVTEWLLPRVERTLRSFSELHGPKAG
jgi:hypothetical protein